jgi:hypothetical protein
MHGICLRPVRSPLRGRLSKSIVRTVEWKCLCFAERRKNGSFSVVMLFGPSTERGVVGK